MKHVLGMTPREWSEVFEKWKKKKLESYLIEITANILNRPVSEEENGENESAGEGDILVDHITYRSQDHTSLFRNQPQEP